MNRRFLALLLLLACAYQLFGQDSVTSSVVLDSLEYQIDGNTQEKALRALSDLEAGQEYSSLSALEDRVEREIQYLVNRRVFDSVDSNIQIIEGSDNRYSVIITVADAFSITPVPYPSYDSNTGLRLGLKLYWDNFLGTMTDTYLGFGIDLRTNESTGKVEVGEWSINPSISRIRLTKNIFLSVSYSQSFNEEDYIDEVVPAASYSYSYNQSSISLGTNLEIIDDLWYGVNLGTQFRYIYEGDLGPNYEQPWAITPSQNIRYGRVNWSRNFRDGGVVRVSNGYRMGSNPDFFIVSNIDAIARYYISFWKRFNFYTQIKGFYQWGEARSNIGSSLRGIQDNLMSGYTGAFINLSMAFQFWRFEGVWDAQIHPFFDIGIVYNNESFDSYRDFNYSFGADLVLFLDALPSLVAVGSIGIDPKRFDKNNIFDSLEITISSSLFY